MSCVTHNDVYTGGCLLHFVSYTIFPNADIHVWLPSQWNPSRYYVLHLDTHGSPLTINKYSSLSHCWLWMWFEDFYPDSRTIISGHIGEIWTNTVHNYIRQKVGDIEDFKALKVGTIKWWKEHVPTDGKDWTEDRQMLLEDLNFG